MGVLSSEHAAATGFVTRKSQPEVGNLRRRVRAVAVGPGLCPGPRNICAKKKHQAMSRHVQPGRFSLILSRSAFGGSVVWAE